MSNNPPGKQALLAVLEGEELLSMFTQLFLRSKVLLLRLTAESCCLLPYCDLRIAWLWVSMAWEDAIPGLFAEDWLLQGEKTGSGACLVSLLCAQPLGTAEEVIEWLH